MDALQEFETYIAAQKNVAIQFIIIGVGLLLLSILLQFLGKGSLSNGLKIGALVCGLLIFIGGIAYHNTETKLLKTQTSLYQKSKIEFQQVETKRMQKVLKDYPIYQIVFGGFIILSLLVVFFVKNPFWHGVAFAVIIYNVAVLIVEAYSHQSIVQYYKSLIN